MKLTIDGKFIGNVTEYHQDRDINCWIFTLENETEIPVPFGEIKLFTSSGELEIITKSDAEIFNEVWSIVRDFYAPNMTKRAAVVRAVTELNDAGHYATTCGPDAFFVDCKMFSIKKAKNHVHFNLVQHGIRY